MPLFEFKARNKQGSLESGTVDAIDESAAFATLDKRELTVVNLVVKTERKDFVQSFEEREHVSRQSLMIFSRQFSTMVNAGLSIVDSLKVLAEEEPNKYFAKVISEIAIEVEGGGNLSASMAKYPKIFKAVYLGLIKVGESSGKLDEVLLRIADQLEKEYQIRNQVVGAMIYPSFVLATLLVVGVILFTFVIPKLKPLLEGTGIKLPLTTKVMLWLSATIINLWWLILPAIVIAVFSGIYYINTYEGRKQWDAAKIRIPLFGRIFRSVYMARFSRTFSTMISGGVNVIDSLETTADSVGNVIYRDEIMKVAQEVKNGTKISDAFRKSTIASKIVKQMIKVGEDTGTLDTTLEKVANFYEMEVANSVNNMSKILEPLLIIILGIGVAVVVSAVIMPLYDATRSVGKI